MKSFSDYGIDVGQSSSGQIKTNCPECPRRKPYQHRGSQNDRDLSVNIDEEVWKCHRCGWTGSLREKKGRAFVYHPIAPDSAPKVVAASEEIYKWFEGRGISREVVNRNNITEYRGAICFNYFIGEDLVNIKMRTKDKKFSQIKKADQIFYKLNDIDDCSECIITEGEIDALSFEEAGFTNAVSIPAGGVPINAKTVAKKMIFLDNCWEYFEDMEKIYLALDADTYGIGMRDEIARRLGINRCFIVRYPEGCKDANDVLLRHGSEQLSKCLDEAEPYPIEGSFRANDHEEEYWDYYDNGMEEPIKTGWKTLDDNLKLFPSTLMVMTGIPSHGKSTMLDNMLVRIAVENDWKIGIFSPENAKTIYHMRRFASIIIGKPFDVGSWGRMSRQEAAQAKTFMQDHFHFIRPKNDSYTVENILAIAKFQVKKYGIKMLVIDPWNTIVHKLDGDNQTDYTERVLNQFTYFARDNDLLLCIVAHPTKLPKIKDSQRYAPPSLYDIMGSSHWFNKAEIGVGVYRNFDEGGQTSVTEFQVQKVKHNFMGGTGTMDFEYDPPTQRFYEEGKPRYTGSYLKRYAELQAEYPSSWDDIIEEKQIPKSLYQEY